MRASLAGPVRWLLLVGALGCVHTAPGTTPEAPYHEAVDRWTASSQIYANGDERAQFTATFESRDFRISRERRHAKDYRLVPSAEQAALDAELKASDTETSFFVGAYVDLQRENDLESAKSIWRVSLVTPSGEVLPARIEHLGRPDDNMFQLYPYLDTYTRAYRVHFPKVSDAPITLRIASYMGTADLKFERL